MRRFQNGHLRQLALLAISWVAVLTSLHADDATLALRARAAALYSDRSYAEAYQAWKQIADKGAPEADRPKLDFFLADSLWRSQPGQEGVEEARKSLLRITESQPNSKLGAEVWESIGDSWLASDRDWPRAWEAYQQALTFWAASEDVELASNRYLGIVWKATGPPGESNRVVLLPLDVLSNALQIAKSDENTARAHFFLGAWLADQGDPFSLRRAGSEWSQVVAMGPGTAVYEFALFRLAKWSLVAGTSEWKPDGVLDLKPNFQRAYGLFQRYLKEFAGAESPDGKEAAAQIAELRRTKVDLTTDKSYLPGSEPMVLIRSRNLPSVDLTLYRVDLETAFQPNDKTEPGAWIDAVSLKDAKAVRQWKHAVRQARSLEPVEGEVLMEPIAEPGVYILEATAKGGLNARTLILVTTISAIFKPGADWAVAVVCDVQSGQASATATARLWRAERNEGVWRWTALDAKAEESRVLRFDMASDGARGSSPLLLFAHADGSSIFLTADSAQGLVAPDGWRFQVITDRGFVRPGDEIGWKLIAREMVGNQLKTPAGELVEWRIIDPVGADVARGELRLTEFGGGWGKFVSDASHVLGDYSIEFYSGDELIGESALFRLDEPPDPVFSIELELPGQTGRTVRLGETLRIRMQADYSLGGGVSDALVRVTVRESLYASEVAGMAESRVIRQDEMRTAPDGSVIIEIPTPPDSPVDLVYDVAVVVRDASGRELSERQDFVVARHGYFVTLKTQQRVVLPDATAAIFIRTHDANDTPVSTEGVIVIRRETWAESWVSPDGRLVSGEALDQLRQTQFPPSGENGWTRRSRDVVDTEVSRTTLATNAAGEAVFNFVSATDGFFRIVWESSDNNGPPVTGQTALWVSSAATQVLAYRGNGLQIIANPESLSAGEGVNVLIVTDTTQRDVLFTVGAGQDLYSAEVIHIVGDAKLVQLKNDPRFAPNVFVQAATVRSGEFLQDTAEIRFPDWANRLNVRMEPLATALAPGALEKARLTITDGDGNPVQGEVTLGIIDPAAGPLASDNQEDPIDIFHGGLRAQSVPLASSLNEIKTVFETRALRDVLPFRSAHPDAFPATEIPGGSFGQTLSGSPVRPIKGSQNTARPSMRASHSTVALWRPGLQSNTDGVASAEFSFPAAIAKWRIAAWVASRGEGFGFFTDQVQTALPLAGEMMAPRFLIQGDETSIKTSIRNGTRSNLRVQAQLHAGHLRIEKANRDLRVGPDEIQGVSWPVVALTPGTQDLKFDIQSGEKGYALQSPLPILNQGRMESLFAAEIARKNSLEIATVLPEKREAESSKLTVSVAPTLADAAFESLPSLLRLSPLNIEQTIARFVPAAILSGSLADGVVSVNQLASRLNPELDPAVEGAEVFSKLVSKGIQQVYEQQRPDGSWAWCRGGKPDAWMTAYVVWSLRNAQASGIGIREDKIDAAVAWLREALKKPSLTPGPRAWMLHAISVARGRRSKPDAGESAALDAMWDSRETLSPDAVALFALTTHYFGQDQRASALAKMVAAAAQIEPLTDGGLAEARWSVPPGGGVMENSVEVSAFAISALSAIDPENPLIAAGITGLMRSRQGPHWSNSRTTSIALACLNSHLGASASQPPGKFDLMVNGSEIDLATVSDGAVPTIFEINTELLKTGRNVVTIIPRSGDDLLYITVRQDYFTNNPKAASAENPFSVSREILKLDAAPTLLHGWKYQTTAWEKGDITPLNSRIEGNFTIESAQDATYVELRDALAAGLEPVDIQSGQILLAENSSGDTVSVFVEIRDQAVVFQIPFLPAGQWNLHYQLRASMAGSFSGPPASLTTVYRPDAFATTPSWMVRIENR